MSEVMATASHCTGSERKSIPDSSVNTEALSSLGNDPPLCCREEMGKEIK